LHISNSAHSRKKNSTEIWSEIIVQTSRFATLHHFTVYCISFEITRRANAAIATFPLSFINKCSSFYITAVHTDMTLYSFHLFVFQSSTPFRPRFSCMLHHHLSISPASCVTCFVTKEYTWLPPIWPSSYIQFYYWSISCKLQTVLDCGYWDYPTNLGYPVPVVWQWSRDAILLPRLELTNRWFRMGKRSDCGTKDE